MTRKEKQQMVIDTIRFYPTASNRALARMTATSQTLVGKMRALMRGAEKAEEPRIEASGRRARGRRPTVRYYEEDLPDGNAAVYRCYDKTGQLLYIGHSLSFMQRLATHRSSAPWFEAISSITLIHFPDKWAAMEAERIAIRQEQPKYNISGNTFRRADELTMRRKATLRQMSRGAFSKVKSSPEPIKPSPQPTPALIRRPTGRVPV